MNTSFSRWQRFALSLSNRKPVGTTEGLTLVECIMAIVVIALTSAMITPPLFIAAATRMQNQRAEQAMQIAQGEVDRIRALVQRGEHSIEELPAISPEPLLRDTEPPSLVSSLRSDDVNESDSTPCNDTLNRQLGVNETFGVDLTNDGNCAPNFAVQTFRSLGRTASGRDRPGVFCLVVRVYGKPAINSAGDGFVNGLQTAPASLRFTTGEGNQRTRPLAVVTTPMIWSDQSSSSEQIRESGSICS